MMILIDQVVAHTLPAAFAQLPVAMTSRAAAAQLVAIGLQESGFRARRQLHGPARGFWQFERRGVSAVLAHEQTRFPIAAALRALGYDANTPAADILVAIEHNDVLAACFARCLLWASSAPLPSAGFQVEAWGAYLDAWRPGRPHLASWADAYATAWRLVPPAWADV